MLYINSSRNFVRVLNEKLQKIQQSTDTIRVVHCSEFPELMALNMDDIVPLFKESDGFVLGNANLMFGHWNRLIALLPNCGSIAVFDAHGGEFVPGRVDDHIEAIRQRVVLGTIRPVQIDIDITMACQSHCVFCFSSDYRTMRSSGRNMNRNAIIEVIRDAVRLGARVVRFDGGGDPTSSPYLMDALEYCTELGVKTALLTSGDLLSESLMQSLIKACTYVRVSLNAASNNTRSELHRTPQRGSFLLSTILDKMTQLSTMRRTHFGSNGKEHMLLGATSMIHPMNISETYEIATSALAAGLDHISFRVILGGKHSVTFSDSQLKKFRVDCERIRKDLCSDSFQVFFPSRSLSDSGYVPLEYFSECRASTHRILVEVGPTPGEPVIIPCGRYRGNGFNFDSSSDDQMIFGCLSSERSLYDFWMSAPMVSVLSRFPGVCGDCIDRSANVVFAKIENVLRQDSKAQFFPFQA